MVPKSPTPEPPPPTFVKSFFVGTVTSNPDEIVNNVTVQEAKSTHGDKVVDDAVMDEVRSLINDTHVLEAWRTHERALPMHLLLKAKNLADAEFDKYEARIVGGGNLQHRDQDIDTSSFCVRVQFFLMLNGIANLDKLTVRAVDIKTAYLHATVKSGV